MSKKVIKNEPGFATESMVSMRYFLGLVAVKIVVTRKSVTTALEKYYFLIITSIFLKDIVHINSMLVKVSFFLKKGQKIDDMYCTWRRLLPKKVSQYYCTVLSSVM